MTAVIFRMIVYETTKVEFMNHVFLDVLIKNFGMKLAIQYGNFCINFLKLNNIKLSNKYCLCY